jgi:phosphopantothenoylcysteine decarboxylase/phosphopantothenate--cysteine ligase
VIFAMRILITAGPTREYLDDVRYLTNGSSGRMGYALASAAVKAGHQVVLVTGPVSLSPPQGCEVKRVTSSREMYDACTAEWENCDGVIAAAAVCDYRPVQRTAGKMSKTGGELTLRLVETPDILAALGASKGSRWVVGFALEADADRPRALKKLHDKHCDAIVLNSPASIDAERTCVELIASTGTTVAYWTADKLTIAESIVDWVGRTFPASTGSHGATVEPGG